MNVPIQSPVCPSRSMALLSRHADTRKTPSGVSCVNAKSGTGREWPGQMMGPAPAPAPAAAVADALSAAAADEEEAAAAAEERAPPTGGDRASEGNTQSVGRDRQTGRQMRDDRELPRCSASWKSQCARTMVGGMRRCGTG
jgi:hypothetical protein